MPFICIQLKTFVPKNDYWICPLIQDAKRLELRKCCYNVLLAVASKRHTLSWVYVS